jgi:hypothetical protein
MNDAHSLPEAWVPFVALVVVLVADLLVYVMHRWQMVCLLVGQQRAP